MKAINQHEAFVFLDGNEDTYEAVWNQVDKIDKFYSQRLTKELIVEVFSGWRIAGERQLYGSEKMQISFADINPNGIYLDRQRKENDKGEWLLYFPPTLNDFIVLCNAKDFPVFFRDSVKEKIFL